MADPTDEQDHFGGLARDLFEKMGSSLPPMNTGLGAGLAQGLAGIVPAQFPAVQLSGHVPTFAPPALGDEGPTAKADSGDPGAQYSPINQAMQGQAQQEMLHPSRPDLGLIGDAIRAVFMPDGFPKDMFDNYMLAKGPYQLDGARFDDIVNIAGKLMPAGPAAQVTAPDGTPLVRRQFSFYGLPDYGKALGTASIFYAPNGKPVGFYDNYNFDNVPGKSRDWLSRQEIRAMSIAGPHLGAKGFPIYYGEYAPTN